MALPNSVMNVFVLDLFVLYLRVIKTGNLLRSANLLFEQLPLAPAGPPSERMNEK